MTTLEEAIAELQDTLKSGPEAPNGVWRWRLRQGLSGVRDALDSEHFGSRDGWLSARSRSSDRDRARLLARISAIGPGVLQRLDADTLRREVGRLLDDIERYRQRVHDLIYDSVALEIGGSE
ncbi:MAG TPA: hypothetical protein VFO98_04195 [Marmoricola sp.]|jgi:hypothetical protein|nr:hypothetical protein [Marmoricola sp.]